ncbi:hypothetical protein PAESOLCIP111_00966 [Paenibacillus solanacearum]|uniref:Uncharacterized protein n=1 Tax=Paenibacillus solanacearum TaxID=2048548 RepID=A0A916JYT0_9BACL|nr:hypothetical protein [Paenibacillus solanacearum]CAG7607508.1 hypothetical protein PAESOLCIP111_00966 [Paenibacillus solanacearum]
MVDTSRQQTVILQLLQADKALDSAIVRLLEQYAKWLLALKLRRGVHPAFGASLSGLLLSLSTIQNIQLQKNKLYAALLEGESRHRLAAQLRAAGAQLEPRLHRLLLPFKRLIAEFDSYSFPGALYYLREIGRYGCRKKTLFPRTDSASSAPWINPSLNIMS